MFEPSDYGLMLGDRRRMDAYARALRNRVTPSSVVLEIGTGPGVLAVLACQLGARRVYAIEPNPIIDLGRDLAAANGCADRIEFIRDVSTRVTLPEPADLVVSDLRDVLPLHDTHIPSIADARNRLLAPGGTLVPQSDRIWISIVDTPDAYGRHVGAWDGTALGLNLDAARGLAVNEWYKARFSREQLLAPPQLWASLDYRTIKSPHIDGELKYTVERPGTAHGLCAWFDSVLDEGVCFSNAPGEPALLYGNAFFPWPNPVALVVGDDVTVRVRANLVGDRYVWQWNTHVRHVRFSQSTFHGELLSPAIRATLQPSNQQRRRSPSARTWAGLTKPADAALDAAETRHLLEQARDPGYWSNLAPDLSIERQQDAAALGAVEVSQELIATIADRFRRDGYFELPAFLPGALVRAMRQTVDRLRQAGWPAAFAFVYDQFWLSARCTPVSMLLQAILGPRYRQIPHAWTHYVEAVPGAHGWSPHFDDPTRPHRVTVWIPLTSATLDNGCMYVIPRNTIPADLAQRLPDAESLSVLEADTLLHGSRALPAAAGSALGWNFDIIHWGAICARPQEPRVAFSQEFIAAGAVPMDDELPVFDPRAPLPTLAERLRVIGTAIRSYDRAEPHPQFASLAAQLQSGL